MDKETEEFKTTEICTKYPGEEKVSVHYRRSYGSISAREMMDEVDNLPKPNSYFYIHTTKSIW